MTFASIPAAIETLKAGRMVVICNDGDARSEGRLVQAAEFVTADTVNFMATHGRGLVCLALTPERCEALELAPMAGTRASPPDEAFTVSIEARDGVTTGISAADRARTMQVAIDAHSGPHDLVRPGHVFPLRSSFGGVLERPGATEAAVDLARLAGLAPAAVVCTIINDDGTVARVPDLERYRAAHALLIVRIADLIAYRRLRETSLERVASTSLPTTFGDFLAVGYRSLIDDTHHVALVKGNVVGAHDVLVHIHPECLAGDVFHSLQCQCGRRVTSALATIGTEDRGVFVYLARANRPICPYLEGGSLGSMGAYRTGAQILVDLGLGSVRCLTDTSDETSELQRFGLAVVDCVPIDRAAASDDTGRSARPTRRSVNGDGFAVVSPRRRLS
jgi:3,4-dihydroxy 2-butanone 4-phosphate synthase / GTP cyclohydrolase II